jgi:hypothetical protein
MPPVPTACPACTRTMAVTELTCPHCQTRVQGVFETPILWRLSPEQLQFVDVFLRCRGNIREVERELGISYPTVRSRLDQVIQVIAGQAPPERPSAHEILDGLGSGRLTFDEALNLLRRNET